MRTLYIQKLAWMFRAAFVVLAVTLTGVQGISAQTVAPFAPQDHVIVLAGQLLVHVSPDGASGAATEIIRGKDSRVLAVEQDSTGSWWVYLVDRAYGWVPTADNNQPALALFSDSAEQQIIDQADADIAANSGDADAFVARAAVAQVREDYDSAIRDYTQAIQLSPNEGRYYDYRGGAYSENGQNTQALGDYQVAISLGRTLPGTYNRAAIAYDNQNMPDAAVTIVNQAIQLEPDYGYLYYERGRFYTHLNSVDMAITQYGQAISLDPYLSNAYSNRGNRYVDKGNYDDAMADFNQAIQIDPGNSQAYVNRGALYINAYNDQVDALADFNQAVAADPENASAYMNRGVSYMDIGNFEVATSDLERAIALDPNDDTTLYNLGLLYSYLGRYSDAVDAYTKAIAGGDQFDDLALLYRSQVYHALGDDQDAVNDIQAYLRGYRQCDCFNTTATLVRAYLDLYLGDYASADTSYRAALAQQGDFVIQYHSMGAGNRVTPLRENMIADLQAQITASPQNALLYLQEANLYMEFGRWREAVQAYHQYMDMTPDSPEALAALVRTLEQYFV